MKVRSEKVDWFLWLVKPELSQCRIYIKKKEVGFVTCLLTNFLTSSSTNLSECLVSCSLDSTVWSTDKPSEDLCTADIFT